MMASATFADSQSVKDGEDSSAPTSSSHRSDAAIKVPYKGVARVSFSIKEPYFKSEMLSLESSDFERRDTSEEEEEEEEEEDDGVPYDRGWAWMVVLGLFVNFMLLFGFMKSRGLIFVQLMERFDSSATHTTLLFTIRALIYSFTCLFVMNVCLGRIEARNLIVTGTILMSLSCVLSSVANKLILLISVHTVPLGMGMAMMIGPAEVLVGHYFRRRRAMAIAIGKCGSSVGSVSVPFLITFLHKEYGLSGTLLLYGGICLNILPAALLMRPLSDFAKRQSPSKLLEVGAEDGKDSPSETTTSTVTRQTVTAVAGRKTSKEKLQVARVAFQQDLRRSSCPAFIQQERRLRSGSVVSEAVRRAFRNRALSEAPPNLLYKQHFRHGRLDTGMMDTINKSWHLKYMSESLNVIPVLMKEDIQHRKQRPSIVAPKRQRGSISLDQDQTKLKEKLLLVMDFSVFRQPLFYLLLGFFSVSSCVDMIADFLPAIVDENGIQKSKAALLLSVIGGIDFFCRLTFGFLADLQILRVSTIICIAFFILSVMAHFVRFMRLFEDFVVLAVIQGMFGSVGNCLAPVLIIDFVGLENMGKAIGFLQLVSGVAMTCTYPILGYVKDTTGSYHLVYHLLGFGILIAAGLLCCEGLVRRLEARFKGEKS